MLILDLDDFYSHVGKDVDLYTQDDPDEDLECRRDRAIDFAKDAYTYIMDDLLDRDEHLKDWSYYPTDACFDDIVDSCVCGDRYDLQKIYKEVQDLAVDCIESFKDDLDMYETYH